MSNHRHFIIHKPFGYLSQFVNNQNRRRNKKLLGELHDFPVGTMAIGRLDEDSEGLLLLTTDGKVSMLVRSKNVEKEYHVQVDGTITDESVRQLQQGVDIATRGKTYRTLPAKATKLDSPPTYPPRTKRIRDERHGPTSWLSITITEGKFRQIRKMTAAVGFPTLRLIRVRIGSIALNKMLPGEVIEVDTFALAPKNG
ncbi:MAG: pseudouridine synthase [Tunicatimonas sp.]|uniref:pseudouridine synthase n=1 Tax=Tunicatimonas sp. TaxID=1940096 RepID=UPI003C796790